MEQSVSEHKADGHTPDREVRVAHVAAVGVPGEAQMVENIKQFASLTGQLESAMTRTPPGEVHPAIREAVHHVVLAELSPITHANRWAEVEPQEVMELVKELTTAALQFQKNLEAQGPLDKTSLEAAVHHFAKQLHTHPAIQEFREPDETHGLDDGRYFTGETPDTCVHAEDAKHKKYLIREILDMINPWS